MYREHFGIGPIKRKKENKENSTNKEINDILKEVCSMKIKLEEMNEKMEEKVNWKN